MTFFQNKWAKSPPPGRSFKQKPRAPPESQQPGNGQQLGDQWLPGCCDSGGARGLCLKLRPGGGDLAHLF